jgi:hypothetical protein
MSLFNLLLAIVLPWALLHFIRHAYLRFTKHHDVTLPLTATTGHARFTRSISENFNFTLHTKQQEPLEIGPLWMKFETGRWNNTLSRSRFLGFLANSGQGPTDRPSSRFGQKFGRFIFVFYTIGAGMSVLVLVVGILLLCISALVFVWRGIEWIFGESSTNSLSGNGGVVKDHMRRLVKRAAEEISSGAGSAGLHSLVCPTKPISTLEMVILTPNFLDTWCHCSTFRIAPVDSGYCTFWSHSRVWTCNYGSHVRMSNANHPVANEPSSIGKTFLYSQQASIST